MKQYKHQTYSGDAVCRFKKNQQQGGSLQPGRNFNAGDYRHSFNGKVQDNNIKGTDNSLDIGARIYDLKIGQWLSVDPLNAKYPDFSPLDFVVGNPIRSIDSDGIDIFILDNPDGASGYDHMSVSIGNDKDGWIFISKEARDRTNGYYNVYSGCNALKHRVGVNKLLNAFRKVQEGNKDLRNYTQSVRLKSTRSWCHFPFNNCTDAVSDGFGSRGDDIKTLYPCPNIRFKRNCQKNPRSNCI